MRETGKQEEAKRRDCTENMRFCFWCRLVLVLAPIPQSLFFPPITDGQEAAAQLRERRGALCVSKNVVLIGGSVAVMRYQPPANKRVNVKRWRWLRRSRSEERGWRRWSRTRGRRKRRSSVSSTKFKKRSRAKGSQQLGVPPIQCFD